MMTEHEGLKSSAEDYLVAILVEESRHGQVRSIDVAQHLNVTKPSVSVAIHTLEKKGYLYFDDDKFVHLTEEGRSVAEKIYERHRFFKSVLLAIGVEDTTAEDEACQMEHAISDNTFSLMKRYCENNACAV